MPNMSPTKVPMPQQDPNVRNKNLKRLQPVIQPRWQWRKQPDVLTVRTDLV